MKHERIDTPLFLKAGTIAGLIEPLTILASRAPDRLTLTQMLFFILAAKADLSGKPTTFTEIRDKVGDPIGRSLHTTYKIFLEQRPRRDRGSQGTKGLGWLYRVVDPEDERRKLLRLTPKGKEVMAELAHALMNGKG